MINKERNYIIILFLIDEIAVFLTFGGGSHLENINIQLRNRSFERFFKRLQQKIKEEKKKEKKEEEQKKETKKKRRAKIAQLEIIYIKKIFYTHDVYYIQTGYGHSVRGCSGKS